MAKLWSSQQRQALRKAGVNTSLSPRPPHPCGVRFTPLPAFISFISVCCEWSDLNAAQRINDSDEQLNCPIKASPNSKASAPGMARPIGMDAGFLCDRAGLDGAGHPINSNPT
ncbi:hypothetical protein [Pantoea dispersa]|uniref:hypothetical protein n=1 Tax=Pantoea dispersa TaxID=59814 RepID=UPI0021C887A6|nr:hypothetical protein [Pantoea dispersa]